jgi:hypothetical protein
VVRDFDGDFVAVSSEPERLDAAEHVAAPVVTGIVRVYALVLRPETWTPLTGSTPSRGYSAVRLVELADLYIGSSVSGVEAQWCRSCTHPSRDAHDRTVFRLLRMWNQVGGPHRIPDA